MNKDIMRSIFTEYVERFENKECPLCSKPIDPKEFKNKLSKRDFEITGLCQNCQDEIYVEDESR